MTWDELCDHIEGLIIEHGQMIFEENERIYGRQNELEEDDPVLTNPPNWAEGIMALNDWTLTFSIRDTGDIGGNWILFIEPKNQPPYRGVGLLYSRIHD